MALVLLDFNPFRFLKTACLSMVVGLIFFITVGNISSPIFIVVLRCVELLFNENVCACKMCEISGSVRSVDED